MNIYSGNDDQVVPLLALGGKGVISVVSNVAPELVHNCCQAFFDGDTAKARDLQLEMLPLSDALFCEVNPIPVKYAMNLLAGRPANAACRWWSPVRHIRHRSRTPCAQPVCSRNKFQVKCPGRRFSGHFRIIA